MNRKWLYFSIITRITLVLTSIILPYNSNLKLILCYCSFLLGTQIMELIELIENKSNNNEK